MDTGKYKKAMRKKKYLDGNFVVYDKNLPEIGEVPKASATDVWNAIKKVSTGEDKKEVEAIENRYKKEVDQKFNAIGQRIVDYSKTYDDNSPYTHDPISNTYVQRKDFKLEADLKLDLDFGTINYSLEHFRGLMRIVLSNCFQFASPERKLAISVRYTRTLEFSLLVFEDNGIGFTAQVGSTAPTNTYLLGMFGNNFRSNTFIKGVEYSGGKNEFFIPTSTTSTMNNKGFLY